MGELKDNISFILVEPREAGNIGASARAIKNMGFRNLELVNPRKVLTDEARRMACDAIDLIESAKIHSNLKEAIQDKGLIIGTTRRLGRRRGVILPLKEGIRRAVAFARKNRVAFLFGREDKGLLNREVEECGFLITIPADPLLSSLNLAQSILLVAYELGQTTCRSTVPELVKHDDLGLLYRHLASALKLLEYIPKGDRDLEDRILRNLKHLIGRAGLTDWELRMLHGICSQIEIKMGNRMEKMSKK